MPSVPPPSRSLLDPSPAFEGTDGLLLTEIKAVAQYGKYPRREISEVVPAASCDAWPRRASPISLRRRFSLIQHHACRPPELTPSYHHAFLCTCTYEANTLFLVA